MLQKVLTIQKGARYGWDGSGNEATRQVATRPLCVRMASNFYQGAKEGESPRRALHKRTVKCMLLQKGAVNYCGCISRIEGAYIRIVGASAPKKRYKITPLKTVMIEKYAIGIWIYIGPIYFYRCFAISCLRVLLQRTYFAHICIPYIIIVFVFLTCY